MPTAMDKRFKSVASSLSLGILPAESRSAISVAGTVEWFACPSAPTIPTRRADYRPVRHWLTPAPVADWAGVRVVGRGG